MEWQKLFELLFLQFPVAGLNLAAVYFAFRFIERRDARHDERADKVRREMREDADREILRAQAAFQEHLASKEREIARLADGLSKQVRDLARKVDDFSKS